MSLFDNDLLTALEVIIKNRACRKYTLNILDEIHANENAHTRIFIKLLQYKNNNTFPFLKLFIELLNRKLPKQFEISFTNVVTNITGQKDYIDAIIENEGNWAIIVENKIEGAVDQPNQIDRYVQATLKSYKEKQIYVVYLTATSEKKVSDNSLHQETKDILGYVSEEETGRFIPVNYKEHILPLVDDFLEILKSLDIRENVLESAVEQYLDYLTGRFSMRKQDKEYFMNMAEDLIKNLDITNKNKREQFNAIEELEKQLPQLLENIKYSIYPNEPKRLIDKLYNDYETSWTKLWTKTKEKICWSFTYDNPYIHRIAHIKKFKDDYYWGIDFKFTDSSIFVYPMLQKVENDEIVLADKVMVQEAIQALKDKDDNSGKVNDSIDKLDEFIECPSEENYYICKKEDIKIDDRTFDNIYDEVKNIMDEDFDTIFNLIQ